MKIGINLPLTPDPQKIRQYLRKLGEAGFEHFEINLGTVPLIINGQINAPWLDYLKNLLLEFPFTYSAHIGQGIDCRCDRNYETHKQALLSSVIAAGTLRCDPLVLHYEQKTGFAQTEAHFFDAHAEAARAAQQQGITLCVENIEVEHVDPVIEFVKRLNHPHLRMNYDLGHGFLASRYYGFDFLESLKKALPVMGHLHLSDNAGTFEELRLTDRTTYDTMNLGYRFALGRGDVHLPPLWGSLPYVEAAEILKGYQGIGICEFYSDYFTPFLGKIRSDIDALFNAPVKS